MTTDEILTDDEMTTAFPTAVNDQITDSVTQARGDGDGTDGDGADSDGADGDGTDGDGSDSDGTDGDGTDGDATDA